MQEHTQAANALQTRVRQVLKDKKGGMENLAYLGAGFLAANAAITGGLAPFGVALAAAAAPRHWLAASLGATLGYLFTFTALGTLKYVLAMALLMTLRWVFSSGALFQKLRMPGQILLAFALGIPSVFITSTQLGSVYDMLLAVSEVLLACCAAYFFARTAQVLEHQLVNARQTDITAVVITFCIAVLALLNLHVLGLSLGRILAAFVILLAVQAGREAGGAIAGVTAGIAVGALGGGEGFFMSAYGFGGLLAGVFAPMGKIASIVALAGVHLFALLASRQPESWRYLAEVMTAGLLSLFMTPKMLEHMGLGTSNSGAIESQTYKTMLDGRLSHMSGALRDVAATTRGVSQRLSGTVGGDPSSVYHAAAQRVCRYCKNKNTCWQARYNDTSNILNGALGVLRKRGVLTAEDFPDYFVQECQKTGEICQWMNRLFDDYTARENLRRKTQQVRGVVTDQFEGMALMIDAMGKELDQMATQDNASAGRVREYFKSITILPEQVICAIDNEANMRLEVTLPAYKLSRLNMAELTVRMGELCDREFDLPAKYTREGESVVTLTFWEKATYTVKWGATQLGNPSSGSRLCGDSYSYVDGSGGRVNIILSDGMGSGGAAAVDSTMTAELLKRLIEAGVSMDASLKLVNSALLVKSGDESLATIDLTGIDLYTGKVEFYKAGAAPTFLRKSGKSGYVESRSLPVGILNGVSFEKNAVTLRDGDWILMVTDGAVAGGYEWILSELEHYHGTDPKALTRRIAQEARRRRDDGHQDDITVIAVLLEKGV